MFEVTIRMSLGFVRTIELDVFTQYVADVIIGNTRSQNFLRKLYLFSIPVPCSQIIEREPVNRFSAA